MFINNEEQMINLIEKDQWMMDILFAVQTLNLPDWWVCAGFVRSKIWDTIHGFSERTPLPDIDVIYFDEKNIDELVEKKWENQLKNLLPNIPWSVKNEARMHLTNHIPPYTSSVDAISKFPETASALGVTLRVENKVVLAAPFGIVDAVNLLIKPTPFFLEAKERTNVYNERVLKKNWQSIWTKLKFSSI